MNLNWNLGFVNLSQFWPSQTYHRRQIADKIWSLSSTLCFLVNKISRLMLPTKIECNWQTVVTLCHFHCDCIGWHDRLGLVFQPSHPTYPLHFFKTSRKGEKEKAICDGSNGGCTNDAPVKQGVKFHYLKKLVVHKWLTQFCSSPTVVTQEKVQNEAWMQDVGVKFHSWIKSNQQLVNFLPVVINTMRAHASLSILLPYEDSPIGSTLSSQQKRRIFPNLAPY